MFLNSHPTTTSSIGSLPVRSTATHYFHSQMQWVVNVFRLHSNIIPNKYDKSIRF